MTRWQYRLRYTNLPYGEGGPDAQWRDVGTLRVHPVIAHSDLQFRHKPRRSLVAAISRRAGKEQQRGGEVR